MFIRAEKLLLSVLLAMLIVDVLLVAITGMRVEVALAMPVALGTFALIAAGVWYRKSRQEHGLAALLIGTGLFVTFTYLAVTLNYLLLPFLPAHIDHQLAALDRSLGFDWMSFVTAFAQYPSMLEFSGFIYGFTTIFVVGVMLFLGFSRRLEQLHIFLLAFFISGLTTIGIWSQFPSAGAVSIYALSDEIAAIIRAPVDAAYAAELHRLFSEGVNAVDVTNTVGLIGFPSFHTVMFLMPLIALRKWPLLALAYAPVMLCGSVSIIVHGGHHLVDLLAGGVIALAAYALAERIIMAANTASLHRDIANAIAMPHHVPHLQES